MGKSTRIADLRVSRTTIMFVRYVYPFVILWALILRRCNEKKASRSAEQLGKAAARVVVSSQQNAETLRRLTYVIAAATIISTGFIIYSALK
jgi:hypothetical protein